MKKEKFLELTKDNANAEILKEIISGVTEYEEYKIVLEILHKKG